MSISEYEFLSVLESGRDYDENRDGKGFEYKNVLDYVRKNIAENNSSDLSSALDNEESAKKLKTLILKYASECLKGRLSDKTRLTESIFADMAGLGILTKYLYDPSVEEININGFDSVEIIRGDATEYLKGDKAFSSPEDALDMVKRMMRMGGIIIDAKTPAADSYISSGTRISAMIPPLVPLDRGVAVSIRKQNKSAISGSQLIESGAADKDVLDFLTMCLCYGVSLGVAGSTGSGKSTLMTYLLNEYISRNQEENSRIFIIEDSREIRLTENEDVCGRPPRVIYTLTKPEPDSVSMLDLIKSALRFHPSIIVPAEVRDASAYEAMIAGQTGHTILTSFHADSARESYKRLSALCASAGTPFSDERLMDMCISAWPVIVYQKQLKDGGRRIMEVFEATGHKNGRVTGNMLFSYDIKKITRDENGRIVKIDGSYVKKDVISDDLRKRLIANGCDEKRLKKLFPKAEEDGK